MSAAKERSVEGAERRSMPPRRASAKMTPASGEVPARTVGAPLLAAGAVLPAGAGTSSAGRKRAPGQFQRPQSRKQQGAARQLANLLAAAAPHGVSTMLAAARTSEAGDTLDSSMWGPAPTAQENLKAITDNLSAQFAARRTVEQACVSRADAANLLGTSEQTITGYLEAGRLLGLKQGRRWLIPVWQLSADTERGILPGLSDVADAFPGGLTTLSLWVTRPSADLDGRPPREALIIGDVEPVVRAARALTAAGW